TAASTSSTGAMTTGADSTTTTVGDSTSATDGDGSSGAASSTSAAPGECAFAAAVDEALADSPVPATDCGAVGLDDDLAAWEAARQCARDAALDQTSYEVSWQWQDGAMVRDAAIAAVIGEVFATYRFDDDAAMSTSSITVTTCTGIGVENECEVGVGQMCLDCLDPGDPTELCD
ncbi:MAG TPA: hypothetical protein VFG69_08995, partial [Nannocystaceae bacterium]|nr:hypothetical protein [Nannocystaceae bacterium]